jgi:hypothetical protein
MQDNNLESFRFNDLSEEAQSFFIERRFDHNFQVKIFYEKLLFVYLPDFRFEVKVIWKMAKRFILALHCAN